MFDIYNYRQFMKLLTPKIQVVLTGVKSIYLNPYHYTYVIQKQDNHIYLYDEMTMQIIGRTKVPFNQSFKTFTFTDNFNIFCTYIEGRSNPPQQSQVIVFTLQPDGVISYARYMLTRNKSPQNLVLFHICFYEKDSKEKERFIIGLGRSKIYYINLNGEVVKEIQIRYEYRELNLINGFSIKQNKWIFIEDSRLYFATITDKYVINDSLPLENKIASIFLDASIRGQFMAFITQLHTIIILSRKDQKWSIRHKFKVPNLNIRKLCFFYPGINTSTTNKFKDRVYLIIYGAAPNLTEQRNKMFQMYQSQLSKQDNVDRYPVPKEFSEGEHLFIHEYSIEELMGNNGSKSKNIVPKGQFCIKNIGVIKYTIWSNQHNENCVLLFNQNKMIISVDLISILQDAYAGKEWVCLSYRFQAKTANVLFEETEDNFEIEKKQTRTISMAQVNDWSYCLFPKESFIKKSIKRLNCIQF